METFPKDERPGVTAERVGFSGRFEQVGEVTVTFVGQNNDHGITNEVVFEARRHAPYNFVNVPGPDRNHLEGTSIPQIAEQIPKRDFKTTVNNNGAFHDSSLPHIAQGDYGTVNQGNSVSIGNTFVNGNMVQNVNENGVSGAVLSYILTLFIPADMI